MAARVALAVLVAVLAAVAPAPAAPLATFGFDPARTSFDPLEAALTPATVPGLRQLWATDVGAVVDTQASYVPGVGGRDLGLVGTEQGDEVALDAANGAVVWPRSPARGTTPCHDTPGGVYGISAAAVVDGGRAYVAASDGALHALDGGTAPEAPGYPVRLAAHPEVEHVWGGLTLGGGRLYAGIASYCDNAHYRGSIVAVDIARAKRVARVYLTRPRVRGGG